MPDDPDPPRKTYQLKPREFDAVNVPASMPAPKDSPTDVQGHLRAANATTPAKRPARATDAPSPAPASDPNDVRALLRDNAAQAKAAGLDELAPKPRRRSRRTRDFWLVLVPVNALFAWWAFGPKANAVTFVFGIGGMAVFTAGLAWVMFFVMDDY